MGSDSNGLQQSPWDNLPVPVPSATSGDQGIGGGLDFGPGPNGITQTPFDKAIVPLAVSVNPGSEPFGNQSKFASIDGSTHEGESLLADITMPPMHTIDKR